MKMELKERELVEIAQPPSWTETRCFGVALDNEEAQFFHRNKFPVRGDDQGPYLVIRHKSDALVIFDDKKVDVKFQATPWTHGAMTGVGCRFEMPR